MQVIKARKGWNVAIGLAAVGSLAGLVVWLWPAAKPHPGPPGNEPAPTATTGDVSRAVPPPPVRGPGAELAAACQQLARTPSDAAGQFAALRRYLASLPPSTASAAIREFLASKADAPSQLGFRIGADGSLAEAPSLRVFLLDYLAQLDPAAAAAAARDVLRHFDSPDEWAVALRNSARGDASVSGRAYVLEKTAQILQHEPWQQQPAAGFLEAFDVAVWLGGTNLVPALGHLVQMKDNPAVAHAAFLALDRLTINAAAPTLELLEQHLELMAGREETRAGYFARADVREASQRAVLERYLLNPALSDLELQRFAGLYPNANFMVSQNLLTQVRTPDHAALTARDATALRVAQEWLADPRFERAKPHLQQAAKRLETFVQQAAGAR